MVTVQRSLQQMLYMGSQHCSSYFVKSDGSCASKQFGEAYDALSSGNLDKLKASMQHATKIQRAILRQGSAAITKGGSIRSDVNLVG